jgi:hypothetical protein
MKRKQRAPRLLLWETILILILHSSALPRAAAKQSGGWGGRIVCPSIFTRKATAVKGCHATQVVDNSPKKAKMRVVSRLIFRRLGVKPRVFDPFLTCKWVDFPALTEKLPGFFASGAVRFRISDRGFWIVGWWKVFGCGCAAYGGRGCDGIRREKRSEVANPRATAAYRRVSPPNILLKRL